MGCCLGCMKADGPNQTTPNEKSPLVSSAAQSESTPVEATSSSTNFSQSIIADAQGKFITATYRKRANFEPGIEDMRSRLSQATVDQSLMLSPPSRHDDRLSGESTRHRISEIMSEPVTVSPHIDMASDEIAELISYHSFSITRVDDSQSTLVSLKPVSGPLSQL